MKFQILNRNSNIKNDAVNVSNKNLFEYRNKKRNMLIQIFIY